MDVPISFLSMLWNFISFLPFFFMLLLLGIIKAAIIGSIVAVIVFVGNSAVIIGLWPAHFFWTYYCCAKTRRLGPVLKTLMLIFLLLPLVLWPIFGIFGSFLAGIGYGYFAPLIATFEAVGEHAIDKLYHCFLDGCWSTIKGACTLVRDFLDFCFHSYFSFMDDLSEKVVADEMPLDVKLFRLPSCLLACLLAVPIDVLTISILALWKSPYMLLKGWQRLFQDLIGREGPFLETVCVPFAGLAILLWPVAVVGAVIAAFICSFFLGLYAGFIVYQENSIRMGLAYIISVISMFDEYTNDLLYLREGSCLPRPRYRKAQVLERKKQNDQNNNGKKNMIPGSNVRNLATDRSRTLRKAIQQLRPIQLWDWLFKSCELNGRVLIAEGLINIEEIEECIIKGNNKKLRVKLPALCILQCLLRSAKSNSDGLLISDGVELTNLNWSNGKVLEWLLEPLLIMKEQISSLQLDENEEACLRKLIMVGNNERPEDWDDSGFSSDDNVRRALLQAIFRRLQGIVASMTRFPTFRRKFNDLVKALYLETIETDAVCRSGGASRSRGKISILINGRDKQNKDTEKANASSRPDNICEIV